MRLIFVLLFGFTIESRANDITVIDVRRNITLADNDNIYKDFYLNAGPSSGLKKNLVVTAVRKLNIRDASGANAVGEISVPVGQLKVIAVYDKVAVAREYTLLSRDELPMLEQIGIMNGDRIDLKGSFIDSSKPKPKAKTAQNVPAETAVLSVVTKVATTTVPAPDSPAPPNPVVSAKTTATRPTSGSNGEILEKTADSGNNSGHE